MSSENAQSATRLQPVVIRGDAICGNCGNRFDKHFPERHGGEDFVFCNQVTNGDVFTSEPSEHAVYDYLMETEPSFMELAIVNWKRANGHG